MTESILKVKKQNLQNLQNLLIEKQKELVDFELDEDDWVEDYEAMIDEADDIWVMGVTFSPSYVIKNLDETVYQMGLTEYVDAIDKTEVSTYKKLEEEIEEIESEIEELESQIEE